MHCARTQRSATIDRTLAGAARLGLQIVDRPAGPQRRTALMEAARARDLHAVAKLLAAGADRAVADRSAKTAADYAARTNFSQGLLLLLPGEKLLALLHRAVRDGDELAVGLALSGPSRAEVKE